MKLETEPLSLQLLQTVQLLFAQFPLRVLGEELTPGWLQILMLVDQEPDLNQTGLARATHVEPSTIVNKIDQLEKRGWLRRARSRTDRRTHALFLTRRGQEILRQANTSLAQHEKRLMRNLSADEKASLFDLLQRIDTTRR